MQTERKTAFISYSWDSPEHEQWVIDLTNKLRMQGGVDAKCDKFKLYTETTDMNAMMVEQVQRNDYVIIVLTEGYANKAPQIQTGVGFETMLITPMLQHSQDKLIFITRDANREKTTPFQMRSFYSIDFSNPETFDKRFKELLHRIYQKPLYEQAPLGDIPLLEPEKIVEQLISPEKELVIIDNVEEERVLWLLPRGFLIFDNITFNKSSSWSVCAHHYSYEGKWIHSTHYHESYESIWNDNLREQEDKLDIPKADYVCSYQALRFLQKLRHTHQPINIEQRVKNLGLEDLVKYYSSEDVIFLPDVPDTYKKMNELGELRDILEELNDMGRLMYDLEPKYFSPADAHSRAKSLRRKTFITLSKHLEDNNYNLKFLEESINTYDSELSLKGLGTWAQELSSTITDIIN
ncbi:SEFIR domain-containing protein [Priestia megaterium]|uniref:SEFIR domain-containing protein n=1 Tax=Priestia megaterium TaxID=1404 RepID=UPI003D99EF6F